ncbi:SET and MYND domain-containing protein 4-like [Watersipora subatra]|uniref:SET and MYND domain-containing protein 4-like n=1 Tax=Watersipora subatra TaxID=2589382 RepID=UPI00355C4DDB
MEEYIKNHQHVLKECESLIKEREVETTSDAVGDSAVFRKEANELYKNKQNLSKALRLYTLSVQAASTDSQDLSLALGNRSALTFELKYYYLCLRDINSALLLSSTTPDLSKRLLLRKAKCFHRLSDKMSFTQVCTKLCDGPVPLIPAETQMLEKLGESFPSKDIQSAADEKPILVHMGPKAGLPSASSSIEMKVSETKGRYIQARKNISAGSVLMSEMPYVAVLLPDYWPTHCYYCLLSLDEIPLFCTRRECKVCYCGVSCQRKSYEEYHRFECSLLDTVVNTGIGHLAYRVIAATGYSTLMSHRKASHPGTHGSSPVEPLSEDLPAASYDAVYNLVTNEEHILPADLFQYKKTALLLLLCLLDSDFFPSNIRLLEHPDVVYVGTLLLRHVQQLICNAHAITVVDSMRTAEKGANEKVMSQRQEKLASAIYPTASLMNHSCAPNILASFVGPRLIVKNSVDLKAGEEVLNCYGPHYQKMERKERQQSLLSQYYFHCDCQPCIDESSCVSSLKALSCVKCSGRALLISESEAKCEVCQQVYDARSQLKRLMQARQLLEDASVMSSDKGIATVQRAREMLDGVVHKHSMELANAFDLEAKLSASQGNMAGCAKCLQSSISILEHVYPEQSIERAHEYHKLSEVLCNTKQYPRALRYAQQAKSIFTKQYSPSHDLVREVELLCTQIKIYGLH